MRFSGYFLYRVRVLRYPDGAFEPAGPVDPEHPEDTTWVPVPGWAPPGWRPERNYVEIMGTAEFIWPVTNQVYASRSAAQKRAELVASYGATTVLERSNRITWPPESTEETT